MRYNGQSRPVNRIQWALHCSNWWRVFDGPGLLFPVERTGPDNKFYLQAIADHDAVALHSVQWLEMAKWFAIFVDQTTDLCSEPIWPKHQRGLVRTL